MVPPLPLYIVAAALFIYAGFGAPKENRLFVIAGGLLFVGLALLAGSMA